MKPPYDLKKCELAECQNLVPHERNGKTLKPSEYLAQRFCGDFCRNVARRIAQCNARRIDPMEYDPADPNCADLPSPTEIAERALQVRRMRAAGAVS